MPLIADLDDDAHQPGDEPAALVDAQPPRPGSAQTTVSQPADQERCAEALLKHPDLRKLIQMEATKVVQSAVKSTNAAFAQKFVKDVNATVAKAIEERLPGEVSSAIDERISGNSAVLALQSGVSELLQRVQPAGPPAAGAARSHKTGPREAAVSDAQTPNPKRVRGCESFDAFRQYMHSRRKNELVAMAEERSILLKKSWSKLRIIFALWDTH